MHFKILYRNRLILTTHTLSKKFALQVNFKSYNFISLSYSLISVNPFLKSLISINPPSGIKPSLESNNASRRFIYKIPLAEINY